MNVTGLILAGGSSTRFGADKACHPWRGRPLIDHVASALKSVTDQVLVSVGGKEGAYDVAGCVTIADQVTGCGPMGGLYTGLVAMRSPWLLVLACDMPRITSAVLQEIMKEAAMCSSGVIGRTPDGRRHPLCAAYHRSVLPLVRERLRVRELAMHSFIEAMAGVRYADVALEPLCNVNRPSDLAEPVLLP